MNTVGTAFSQRKPGTGGAKVSDVLLTARFEYIELIHQKCSNIHIHIYIYTHVIRSPYFPAVESTYEPIWIVWGTPSTQLVRYPVSQSHQAAASTIGTPFHPVINRSSILSYAVNPFMFRHIHSSLAKSLFVAKIPSNCRCFPSSDRSVEFPSFVPTPS